MGEGEKKKRRSSLLFWQRGEEGEEGQSLTKGRKIVEIAREAEMGSEGKRGDGI